MHSLPQHTKVAGGIYPTSIAIVAVALCASGCFFTTVGLDNAPARQNINFGPAETLRLCVMLDDGITQSEARSIIEDYWNKTEAPKYGLNVEITAYTPYPRRLGDYFFWQIEDRLSTIPIPPACDRMLYFVGRNWADVAWNLVELWGAPEVGGEVDNDTMTRGFVVGRIATINQLLLAPIFSAGNVARHELYHMLGCPHSLTMNRCYRQIRDAKLIETALAEAGCYRSAEMPAFFPAFANGGNGPILLARSQAGPLPELPAAFRQCVQRVGLAIDEGGGVDVAQAHSWAVQARYRRRTRLALR